MTRKTIASTLLLSTALALPSTLAKKAESSCFPFGATFPSDGSAPSTDRSSWFCPAEQQTGFMGFSYPLEVDDCSDYSNSYDSMNSDFARMKSDFGASIVRLYYPACTQASVFENAIKAGVANNMAIIPQIWFGFDGDDSVWKASQQALYDAMEGDLKSVAPYVIHSADFGSEPIGDGVDDGNDQFVTDLTAFKSRMNGYGVPVGISEDWDRPGTMSNNNGDGLADLGQRVKDNSDYAHAHIMPFYHGNLDESDTWGYIEPQMQFMQNVVALPNTFITETQWAWGDTQHYSGHNDVNPDAYKAYWQQFDDHCEDFKKYGIGWFWHAWTMEDTFDEVKDDGSYEIPAFKPRKC